MSYYANTVLPTMEGVFADAQPPTDPSTCATMLSLAGYPNIGDYVASLTPEAYEALVWDAHLANIEYERPQAFADDDEDSYEERFSNK